MTIHAYSPPLWRMGAYEVLPGGELRRHSLSYAEELRPLEPILKHPSVSPCRWPRVLLGSCRGIPYGEDCVASQAMERKEDRSPDVAQAAAAARAAACPCCAGVKRLGDVLLALAMLVALLPLFVVVLLLLAFAGDGWIEQRVRLGRNGRPSS